MAPGLDGLPAAERDVDVSGPVAEFLALGLAAGAGADPARPARLRVAALPLALQPPRPGRPRGLPARAWRRSRFGLYHELLLMAKVFATLGYAVAPGGRGADRLRGQLPRSPTARCPSRPARWARPSPRGEGEECDVVIVGSGAGGAVAAATLAEAGLDVIVLEAGESFNRDSYPSEPLEAIASLYRDGGLTIAEGRPPIPVPVARTVGGTTVVNSGTCFRAPEPVLEDWRRRFGIDWAAELDADFAEAEEFLRVTPLDPERMGRNGQLAMEGAAAIGASGGPISRNAGNCVQCSSCPFGCEIDAKRGMHVSYLPRAVAAGARLRTGVEAQRVLVEDGRAVGVALRSSPAQREQDAQSVAPLHGPGAAGDDRRRRRPRHAGAAAALGPRRPPGRPQPPHPPRLLGRRPLRGGGARLGRRDAELLHRPVGAAAPPARGDLHARSPSAAPGCRAPAATTSARCSSSATSARSASTSPTSPAAESTSPATAPCAPATS